MTQDEFLNLLVRFAARPMPALTGRHLYLWHGDVTDLNDALPRNVCRSVDLHAMAVHLDRAPRAIDGARKILLRSLRSDLITLREAEGQQVVLVTGCDLLSRYRAPLQPFYEIVSEQVMAVLVVSLTETGFRPTDPIPGYVSLEPNAVFDYLRAMVGAASVVNATEELL